jgi:glycosyltransferase involved in cell wall biosynthesis
MDKPVKIVYFLSHPIQYFSPLLKALAARTDLEVYYLSDAGLERRLDKGFGAAISWDIPLLEGYNSFFLENHRKDRGLNNKFLDVWNPGAWKVVQKSNADIVIINGWIYSTCWLVMLAAFIRGKKVWLRAESPLNQELLKSRKVLFVKKLLLKHFLFRFFVSKLLYIGTQSREFFRYYGVPAKRLVYTPYAVDNAFFSKAWQENKGRLAEIRTRLGLPAGKKIILFTGKYIPKKRPLDLLEAFSRLERGNYFLLMVGEGPLRAEMEKFISDRGLAGVRLTGFVNQSEIPLYYSVADVFVMCSGIGETWGLAVNEAMNFEKPVIVSATCGCSTDLVRHGVNGFVFTEGNIAELTQFLKAVLDDEAFCKQAGTRSGEIIGDFSIAHIVENLSEAI